MTVPLAELSEVVDDAVEPVLDVTPHPAVNMAIANVPATALSIRLILMS